MQIVICFLCVLFLLHLFWERRRAQQDRAALNHVVHVNGIRGKSTVTRLIDAGLRRGGVRVFCKTTGTEPMTIDVRGVQSPIRRLGPSNIREQLRVLHQAAGQGAQVLVIECMAVHPELQEVSQAQMLRADLGVITNVRPDHTDVMGTTPEEICDSLCGTVPQDGVLFTAEKALFRRIEQNASRKNCSVIGAYPDGTEPEFDFAENIALALAVCVHLGVDRETALLGMAGFIPDPYALSLYRVGGGVFVNAFSANDAASTKNIYAQTVARLQIPPEQIILLFNNRMDRGARTRDMAVLASELPCREIWLLGAGQAYFSRVLRRRGFSGPLVRMKNGLDPRLMQIPNGALVFAAGNIARDGKLLVDQIRKEGQPLV